MKVRMKKILAGILACTMVVNLVPMEAWAAATEVVLEDQSGSEGKEALDEGESLGAEGVFEAEDGEALFTEASSEEKGVLETDDVAGAVPETNLVDAYVLDEVDLEDEQGDEGIAAVAESEQETEDEAIELGTELPETNPADFKYSVVNGTITITGYTGSETSIAIPKEINGYAVTAIGDKAFYEKQTIQNIILPEGLTSIGAYAFYYCSGWKGNLVIPGSVTSIGAYAFFCCRGLDGDLIIPDTVTSIGTNAFGNCTGLDGSLVISNNMKTIDSYAFASCSGLKGDLIIPNSVKSIGSYAFRYCSGLSGNLTLSGSLSTINSGIFYGCSSLKGDLVIPDSVTSIGDGAFSNCTGLDGRLELSKSLKAIYGSAFYNCRKLSGDLMIPDNVTSIGSHAFDGCSSLDGRLVLSNSLKAVSKCAFYNCRGLNGDLVLPDSVTSIGSYAFSGCSSLDGKLVLPENLETITNDAFRECSSLSGNLVIPESILTIGDRAFYSCSSLSGNLVIPDSVNTVGSLAFADCKGFNGFLRLPENIREIQDSAFYGCSGFIGDLVIPESVVKIGNTAFSGCSGFTGELIIPESVISVSKEAFYGCSGFTGELVIPESVISISQSAFSNCSGITDVVIGGGVTNLYSANNISYSPFSGCSNLNSITFLGQEPPFINNSLSAIESNSSYITNFFKISNLTTVWVPTGCYSEYASAYGRSLPLQVKIKETGAEDWIIRDGVLITYVGEETSLTVPDEVTEIAESAFLNNATLESITLPEGIIRIGDSAFRGCRALKNMIVPDSVKSIGAYAFQNCISLTGVILPTGLTELGAYAFYSCTSLLEVTLPDGLTDLGAYMFYNCTSLTGITLPDGLTELGAYVFDGCRSLTKIILPNSLAEIGDHAFDGCIALSGELTLPEGLTSINNCAFRNCGMLSGNLKIPDGVTSIGGAAFDSCRKLTGDLVIPSKVNSIGAAAFQSCSGFNGNLTFPENLTSIGNSAFLGCYGLTGSLVIPDSVTTIGYNAFYNCYGLTGSLELSDSVTTIGSQVFFNCHGLTGSLELPDSVTTISSSAFQNCWGLTGSLILPDSLTTIGDSAFRYCKGFSGELRIPEKISSLGQSAFKGCTSLTDIVIGSGVKALSGNGTSSTFGQCTGVKNLTFLGMSVPKINYGGSTSSSTSTSYITQFFAQLTNLETVWIPEGCYSLYAEAYGPYLSGQAKIKEIGSTDSKIENGVLIAYTGTDTSYTVPDGVTEIGEGAFLRNTTLEKVVLPEGLTKIGNAAFRGCTALAEITLPAGITEINPYSFADCTGLSSFTLPEGVTSIGEGAFSGCTGLQGELVIPEGVTNIGISAFWGCSGLTGTLVLPDSVASIDSRAFGNCSGLGEVILGTGLKNLHGYLYTSSQNYPAFYGCSGVQRITFRGMEAPVISSSVTATTSNGSDISSFFAVSSLKGLEEIRVPDGCYRDYAESYGAYLPKSVRIHESSTEDFQIEDGILTAYLGDSEAVEIPETVKVIGAYAFLNNQSMKSVVIPKGVTAIGSYAFRRCGSLENIIFPNSVERIGSYAFSECIGLRGNLEFPQGLREIGNYAFSGCNGLNGSLKFQSGLQEIGNYAFSGCKNLTGDLEFPQGLQKIGDYAFYNCAGFTGSLTFPQEMQKIGRYAFSGCSGFSGNLELPQRMQEIGSYAFYNCSRLTGRLKIPQGITAINEWTFYNCLGLTGSPVISDSVTSIWQCAFKNCNGFQGILEIPDSVTYLGNSVFEGCTGFSTVIVGGKVNKMGEPFRGCAGVEKLLFLGADVPIINYYSNAMSSDSSQIAKFFSVSYLKTLKNVYVMPDALEAYTAAWGEYLPESVSLSSDTILLPVAALHAEEVNSRSAELSWTSSGSGEVTGYYIYRDDTLEADVTEPAFHDTGLQPDTTYTYRVTGHTETGQETAPASLTITTATPAVNRIYTENGVYKVGMTNSTLYAEVTDSGNLKSAVGRFYYVDESGSAIPISDALTTWETSEGGVVYQCSWDITQLADGDYTVVFKLTDRDGSEGTLSQTITVDHSVPDALSNVVAVGDTNQIVLSWSIAHEISTEKYHIYRRCEDEDEFKLIKRINSRDTLSYTDTKASKDAKYYYYVVAVNDFGQEGPQSALAVAKPSADTEAPQVVKLTPVNGSIIGGNVEFYAQAQDNVAAVRTELYLSTDDGATWTLLRSIRSNYCRHTLNTADYGDVTISVKGVAYDAAGNESDALAYKYKIDNTGPEKVTGLAYECTATTITLKWNDVADNDFSFFRVEQQAADGTFRRVQDVSSTLGVNIYNLTADTEYTYRVAAYDKVGNRGEASDVITVRTAKDTIAPVITAIKPNANYYNREISYSVTAKDNTAIASIRIQTSPNAVTWTDEKTYTFAGNKQTETAEGVLSLDSFAEGSLYIRGVARDTVGNESDTMSTAPYVQYVVDRTAPAVPKNLKLNVATGAIELTWDMGTEEDLEDYILYRSKDGSSYTQLVSGLHAVNYWDRSVEKGVTYFYKLAVRDAAGNVSGKTEAVQGVLPDDMEAPVIQNYVPLNGSTIGVSNSTFRVMVSDNWKVQNVKVTYTVNEDTEENTLLAQEINHYYANVNAALPVARMNDGDVLHLKVVVTDAQGLKTSAEDITYIVDKIAPRVNAVSAEGDEEKITIRWQGNGEEDLAGYRIYRKTAVGSYVMIAQRSAQEGTEYFYEDYNAEPKATYSYKVEAVDKYGNTHAKESDSVWLNVSPKVTAALSVEAAQEVNVEYFFDGSASFADLGIQNFEFDFGDGTKESGIKTKVIHSYGAVGTYEVTLRVTDTEGQTAEVKKTVTVEEAKLLGTVKVKAVDGNGNPIAGMPVYFDLDHTSENVKYSDVKGYASFVAGAGQYSIGAYKNGYLPAKRTVIVRANSETEIVLTMVKEPIVTGEFEVDRMTLDEIKAAGIDVTKPANQQVVKVKIHLTYGTTPITMNVITNGKDIYSDGTVIVDTDEGTRKLTPTIVDISGGNGEDYTGSDGESVIIAIMDVPVEASYLKEFFDVKLHIVNNASKEFELTNNVVTLNVPEGMSLVEGVDSSVSGTVRFDSLKGQEEKTIGWILRGDTAGEYHLEADYSAILSQFSAPVSAVFRTDTPITVYGMDAIKLVADINRSISYGGFYFNLSMQNIGGADMYLPTIDVMNGIVTAYQEAEEGKAKRVKTLSSLIKNASGYSQYLSADETVSKLSVGETYTKKYACYDTISTDDIARLLDAVYEIAEGMGIQVEVNMTDIDLYSIDSAEEKAESFYTDAQKADIYSYFIDSRNKNFYYYINALKDDKDFVKKLCELFYRTTDCALNLDMDLFTNQNMKDITRKYIYEMLMDETFLDATETKVDDTYLQALKSVIPQILEVLAQNGGLTEETQRAFESVLKERENMRSLALALKQGGKDGFWKKLLEIAETVDDSAVKMALEESLSAPMVSGWCGTALGSLLKEMDGVMQSIDRELEAWYESAELTNQLVTINAAQHEAKTLLQFILNHRDIHPAVYEEAQTIFNGLEEGFKTQEEAFNEELAKLEKQADLNARVEQLLNTKYYSNGYWGAGTVLAALKLVFNNLDDLFGWEESVNAAQSLQAAASITHALRSETMSLRNAGDAEKFLRALKYLVKIRLVGEKTYINLTKQNDGEKGLLASINRGQRANYKSLDAYYSVFRTTVLAYRDILFGDLASRDGIPEAPAVTIDYKKECTVQVFGAAYEYSFDGVSWTACEGSAISLNPGTAGCHLWVRVKESKENLAGNSAKIYIPERPEISEDVSVKYRNGTYRIEGLREGTYYYQLSDQELDAAAKELSFVQEKDAATEVQEDRAYEYMAIAAAATEKAFAGGTRNVRVQKACTVSLKNDAAGGTVQGAGEYYQGELAELMVTVKDGYRFLGWYVDGRLLSEETAYSFSVTEDVEIEARYELAKQIPVTFCGWRNSVLGTEYYNAGLGDAAEILVPNAPVPDGYRFAGWTLDGTVYQAAEIQRAVLEKFAAMDEIAVYAKFEQKTEKYMVTVQNGTLANGLTSSMYQVSSWVTVNADAPEDGKKFAYWMKDGVIVGYAASYTFYMPTKDTLITAVYENVAAEIEKVATTYIENVAPDVANSKLSFVSISMVPQECSILQAGIVATSDASKVTNGAELTTENADYVRGNATSAHNYKYTWTKGKVAKNQNWYVRAYLRYQDENGVVHEAYGDLVTANLEGIVK